MIRRIRCPEDLILGGVIIKELDINNQIRDREIRVIDSDGSPLGILDTREAMRLAEERKLDLVKVSPNAKPPVCKIMDYGKYKYDTTKKEKESRKKQKVINVKEIRMTPTIDEHDLQVKIKNANKFLAKGDRVKVVVRFRGRQLGHTEIGREVLMKFIEATSEFSVVDKRPKMEGRQMVMFLNSKN
ncbi:translation initiation factor IF-3 [Dethiosulfatibacter aminovorans DSM 17477]|uniref:Translation initiation factor IF-3 n=1 Tax=Dethiosulfatibacter aminovorans DSM 17477 TaxID=1121476 RepID=A0A1M6DMQ8_9FIRM|nr:translation initiation factor IF-3 [Dethiosulfatibacter aminovorans]SHI74482.1 translation initiation factor IF-3 [Dethiosulfatibacter aminovorans DSM 17477]